jgi:hypothetical protein
MAIVVGCACDTGNGNTGTPNCVELFGLAQGIGIVNINDSLGVANKLALTTGIGAALTAKLTASDVTQRLYPLTGLRNVDFPLEDTQYETDNTGQKEVIRQGIQSFTAEKWKVSPVLVSKIKQGICARNGAYIFTANGVVGIKVGTDLFPIEVNSLDARYMFAKGDAVAKMMVSFDFDTTVNVGQLWMISWDDLGINPTSVKGLVDANLKQLSTATATGVTTAVVEVTTDYGNGIPAQNVHGLVLADFEVRNMTTNLVITATSVTENVGVSYTIVHPAATTGQKVKYSVKTTTGYEGSVTVTQP